MDENVRKCPRSVEMRSVTPCGHFAASLNIGCSLTRYYEYVEAATYFIFLAVKHIGRNHCALVASSLRDRLGGLDDKSVATLYCSVETVIV